MKLKIDDAIRTLDYDDLIKLNQDLQKGGHDTRSIVERCIVEKEKESGKVCHVCNSEIDPHHPQNYTIMLGPEGLRRKASFCALDCLKYFITSLEKRKEEMRIRVRDGGTDD